MKYGFLTMLIPKEQENTVRLCSRHNMQDAANALQWNLFEGFSKNLNADIKIFNVLPVGSFPQYYSKAFVKAGSFQTQYNQNNRNVGFCNVKLLRKYHQSNKIYQELKKWCESDQEEKMLFVYTVGAPFMQAASRLKRRYQNVRVCAIIADLPDMSSLSSKKSFLQKRFVNHLADVSYAKLGCVDTFVLLTKHMARYMDLQKPWVVMEGIAEEKEIPFLTETAEKMILYTGTLHRRFGVLTLMEAFSRIGGDDYRLVICGVGDSEQEIEACAKRDKRILFKGQVCREEVLSLQHQATVLVNPRQNIEEFTKYSFPSKTMEYLASGVPVVCYKLDGIPDEYDDYLNYVEDNSPEALAAKLVEICEMDDASRTEMGKKGSKFVLENKNAVVQTRRILEFIQ